MKSNSLTPVGVFPVSVKYNEKRNKNEKVPALGKGVNWQTYQATTTELDNAANIGVMIPDGVIVFDLDRG